jgi:hypothetical protein
MSADEVSAATWFTDHWEKRPIAENFEVSSSAARPPKYNGQATENDVRVQAALDLYRRGFPSDSPAMADACHAYFNSWLNADAVAALCKMTGVETAGALLSNKTDRVAELVRYKVPPVLLSLLVSWTAGDIPARGDTGAFNAAALDPIPDLPSRGHPTGLPVPTDPLALPTTVPPRIPPAVPPAALEGTERFQQQMLTFFQQIVNGTPSSAPASATSASVLTPKEKQLKQNETRFSQGLALDFYKFGPQLLARLKLLDDTPARRMISAGVYISLGEHHSEDTSNLKRPSEYWEGYVQFLKMTAEKKPHLLHDRIAFLAALQSETALDPVGRVSYCKLFMEKYSARSDWHNMLQTDHSLMIRVSHSHPVVAPRPTPAGRTDGGGRTAKRARGLSNSSPSTPAPGRSSSQPGRVSGGAVAGPGSAVAGPLPRSNPNTCFSRSDVNSVCRFGDACAYQHLCASCHQDHPASECKSWDPSKTVSRNRPRRGG